MILLTAENAKNTKKVFQSCLFFFSAISAFFVVKLIYEQIKLGI